MPRRKKRKAKARPKCHGWKVWGYPRTEDNDGEIDWAWACRCGRHGDSFPNVDAAYNALQAHFPNQSTEDELNSALDGA